MRPQFILRILSALILIVSLAIRPISAAGLTWSEARPLGNVNHGWARAATSTNGEVILVSGASGQLVISKNRGSTWTTLDPFGDGNDKTWNAVAVSGDGRTLLAAAFGLRVLRSTNGGETWTDVMPSGDVDANWNTATMSADGQTMIAGQNTGRLYLSTNGGTSWSEVQPGGNATYQWQVSAISAGGSTIIAGIYNGRLYRSTNRGSTWSEIQPLGNIDGSYISLGISDNAQTIVTGLDGYRLYLTTDGGNGWQELRPLGDTDNDWRVGSVSGDGKKILVAEATGSSVSGRVFLSGNGGVTFDEVQPAGDVDVYWVAGTVSRDGNTLVAGIGGGRLYLGLYPLPVESPRHDPPAPSPRGCSDAKPSSAPELFQINTTRTTATMYFSPLNDTNQYMISFSARPNAEDYGATITLSRLGVQNFTVSMLSPNTTYYFKVRGQQGCMPGDWSNILPAKTSSGVSLKKFFLF